MNETAGEFLVWVAGERTYGLEISHCQEVVNGADLTPVPKSPAFVAGLINLRGTVIAAIDLEVLLGFRSTADSRANVSIIRVRTNGYPFAIVADRIVDAVSVDQDNIEAAPANLGEAESNFISNVAKTKDGLVLIPNLKTITGNFLENKRSENA